MKKTILHAMAVTAMSVGMASAQGFGGEVHYDYTSSSDDYTMNHISGGVAADIAGGFGVQLNFGSWGYDGASSDNNGIEAHISYEAAPGTNIGVFYTREDWGNIWNHIGVEIATEVDAGAATPLMLEGYFGKYTDEGGTWESSLIGVEVGMEVASGISAYGTLGRSSGDYNLTIFGVSGRYAHSSGGFVELGVNRSTGDYQSTEYFVEAGFEFGGGTTFGGRKWVDHYGGR